MIPISDWLDYWLLLGILAAFLSGKYVKTSADPINFLFWWVAVRENDGHWRSHMYGGINLHIHSASVFASSFYLAYVHQTPSIILQCGNPPKCVSGPEEDRHIITKMPNVESYRTFEAFIITPLDKCVFFDSNTLLVLLE